MSEHQTDKPAENSGTPESPEQQHQDEKPEVNPLPPVKRNYQRFTPDLIEVSRAHQVKKVFQPVKKEGDPV